MLMSKISKARPFCRKFRSLNTMAPHTKVMITELRRSIDTTESIEPGLLSERKYRKSEAVMNKAMIQIAQSCL